MTRKDDMHLELPDSVSSYLRDKDVQTGVDSLGAYELVRMPPSLRWGELPDYYRALLASQQVRIEHALALETLWRETWEAAVRDLTPITIDEQSDETDYELTPAWCFNKRIFVRTFKAGQARLETYVHLDTGGIDMGFAIRRRRKWLRADVEGFAYDEDNQEHWSAPIHLDSDLDRFRSLAHRAVARFENVGDI